MGELFTWVCAQPDVIRLCVYVAFTLTPMDAAWMATTCRTVCHETTAHTWLRCGERYCTREWSAGVQNCPSIDIRLGSAAVSSFRLRAPYSAPNSCADQLCSSSN